jgi:hypothetical protein
MTPEIKKLIIANGAIVCPECNGEGEIDYFCGHETTQYCHWCAGRGIVKSLKRQTQKKDCVICGGKGCAGGCGWKGYREWESFELFPNANDQAQ